MCTAFVLRKSLRRHGAQLTRAKVKNCRTHYYRGACCRTAETSCGTLRRLPKPYPLSQRVCQSARSAACNNRGFAFLLTPVTDLRAAIAAMPASRIREVANAAMHRSDVLAFWFGESDHPPPPQVLAALQAAVTRGQTLYNPNLGEPALRAAIARYTAQLHGVPLAAERIAVTSAGVNALMIGMQAVVNAGDRVVAVTPVWPNLVGIPTILGAEVVRVPLTMTAKGFRLDMQRLLDAARPGTKALIINSPNNPTGWTMSAADQEVVLNHCRQHGIWLFADEVYERLYWAGAPGERAPSFLDIATEHDALFTVNSFSKTWAMTGFRLGWLTARADLIAQLAKLIEFNTSCAPSFVQAAGIAALEHGQATTESFLAQARAARALIVQRLSSMPRVTLAKPDGAMYAFFKIDGMADALATCKQLAADYGLGLAPGSAFGPEGEGFIRWCFASSPQKLAQGLDRFSTFMEQQGR
jgi:aspartate/methionine/tyrosine aminotransferase